MIFKKEVYLTRDMNEYNRAKDVLVNKVSSVCGCKG